MIGQQYAGHLARARTPRFRPPAAAGHHVLARAVHTSIWLPFSVALLFFFVAALIYAIEANQVSMLTVQVQSLQYQHTVLVTQNSQLRAQATTLQTMSRIEAVASSTLHMHRADITNTLWVYPVAPRISVPQSGPGTAAVERATYPLAWLRRFLIAARASL